ncbi:hypothetical protein DWQ65_05555 [Treponema phagedenis]|uniref:Uncharacterized protein n=1 Tax=Treponema phagedenis TaxID=162 RepID=A0A0B7GWC9_TREPH|nr:permease prefix domain 1-containing protein [Treponema phagedenis]NVP24649.1 hypothetical protein [Treponema phagedenis]QEJ94594.1 hypothetical protein FUT79_04825 [Treponema phagedenis]QEJ97601.1 hypothetical protein FUT82_06045 [Treponema phagedenis]QEK00570.1 hypothetical protein FUT84_04890 [Treponema phagedenis]QEK03167.1 hypothetical protein FUT83_04640 [Treponema phagedenis]
MEKIVRYIDNVFSSCPRTEEAARLKMQLIDNLIEKYNALLAVGKNEDEAFGIVITGFGDIEEIKKTLKQDEPEIPEQAEERDSFAMNSEEIIAIYREVQNSLKKTTRWEFFYCVAGLVIVMSTFIVSRRYGWRMLDVTVPIALLMFFVCIGLASARFILYAVRILNIERNLFDLAKRKDLGTENTKMKFTDIIDDLKAEGKLPVKKLQATIILITAAFFLLYLNTGGRFGILFFIILLGFVSLFLVHIWLK